MLAAFFALAAVGFALGFRGYREVRAFLASNEAIRTPDELERFKELARRNMYGALAMLAVAVAWVPIIIYLLFRSGPWTEKVAVAATVALFGWFGSRLRTLEVESRMLPVEEALKAEYASVSDVWERKPFPSF
jgi:hypothetical protein